MLAKYRCLAAAKLVELTTSDKAETARRACLDIICQPKIATDRDEQAEKVLKSSDKGIEQLSDATASRLLAVMAEEKSARGG